MHIAEAIKTNGDPIRLEVIAYDEFCGKRISLVDELTHLLDGAVDDGDLGSRMAS